ncbi:MAG: hypothetical protein MRY78_18340 [Saprospiraceae bacterium]|nr:hypothetical protein [Saprospiraceae bacterium]
MKHRISLFSFMTLALLSISLSGCFEDECTSTITYRIWEPVYMETADIRQDISIESARPMQEPGNIYYYQDYLLINERGEGVHIIDNHDPASPQAIGFVKVPGAQNMAVRNGVMYVDNYIDLLALDLSNPAQPSLLNRVEDVFIDNYYYSNFGYIVEYKETEQTETRECASFNDQPVLWENNVLFVDMAFDATAGSVATAANNAVGVGGSMAQFTIAKSHLYVVDDWTLKVFDLAQAEQPELANTVDVGWGIETIFPYGDNLFIGANDGMYIFDNNNPTAPFQLSKFEHAQACDPVFVKGNIAYVTLRDGNQCQNFFNQLDVVDITNLSDPKLLATHQMHNPHGLSVVDDAIYICENDEGVKVFDVTEVDKIGDRLLDQLKGFNAYDVIGLGGLNVAMVIGDDGLYQFDITDRAHPRKLSVLPVQKQ